MKIDNIEVNPAGIQMAEQAIRTILKRGSLLGEASRQRSREMRRDKLWHVISFLVPYKLGPWCLGDLRMKLRYKITGRQ